MKRVLRKLKLWTEQLKGNFMAWLLYSLTDTDAFILLKINEKMKGAAIC